MAGRRLLASLLLSLLALLVSCATTDESGSSATPQGSEQTAEQWNEGKRTRGQQAREQQTGASVASTRFCEPPEDYDAVKYSRAFIVADLIRRELDGSNVEVALVSRTGMALDRLGIRFTHAAIALKEGGAVPWSVRQLYFACDEGRPRLYDQGFASFLLGSAELASGHVTLLLLPADRAGQVRQVALDQQRALRLLANLYSANAYPFSTIYQNCNQWVVEMLATAWGELPDGNDLRQRAQEWLASNAYQPSPVDLGSWWIRFVATFSPLVHLDDHPQAVRDGLIFQTSLPTTIEAFVRARYPVTRRIELCWNASKVVIREGWDAIEAGCREGAEDRVIPWEHGAEI